MDKPKTVADIAKMAGVSKAAVSIVINDRPGVSDATRQRILNLLSENGVLLKTSRTTSDVIALCYQEKDEATVGSNYGRQILEGLSLLTMRYNLKIMLVSFKNFPKDAKMFRIFCAKYNIGAAVFFNIDSHTALVNSFADIVTTIVIGVSTGNDRVVSVKANNRETAKYLTKHIIDNGHRKIAFCNIYSETQDHQERLEGYKEALEEAGIPFNSNLIFDITEFNDEKLINFVSHQLMGTENMPTAVVAVNDRIAVRLINAFKLNNIRVPEDVSITGFDNSSYAAFINPPLTTAKQPIFEMGAMASRIIVDELIDKKPRHKNAYLFECKPIIRSSVAKID